MTAESLLAEALDLSLELGKARDLARTCGKKILEVRTQLKSLEASFAVLEGKAKALKAAKITILSEYEFLHCQINESKAFLDDRRDFLKKLEEQAIEMSAKVPKLHSQLQALNERIANASRVIPFRR